jgi:integrase
MPRTVRDTALDNRTARGRLKARTKPYYRALEPGLHLGYRKPLAGPGRWLARHYVGDQKYELETIGTADDFSDADGVAILNFAQAQTLARKRMVDRAHAVAGKHGPLTVEDVMDNYLAFLATNRKSVQDIRYRVEAFILPDLGKIEVERLTTERLRDWHASLATLPSRAWTKSPRIAKDQEGVRQRRSSANRVLIILRAALSRAWREGKISSDAAWRRVEPFKGVNVARIRYLTVDEARRLINGCFPDFRALVEAALQTGCRLGELVRLEARDFNPDVGTLAIRQSKSGRGRHVMLTEEGVELFRRLAAGRPGNELLLRKADGTTWGHGQQFDRMADACRRGSISPPIGFHGLRHTYASLSIMSGAPLLAVARNLGHSDTKMVEAHYGHLSQNYLADTIRTHAPRFGTVEPTNVTNFKHK